MGTGSDGRGDDPLDRPPLRKRAHFRMRYLVRSPLAAGLALVVVGQLLSASPPKAKAEERERSDAASQTAVATPTPSGTEPAYPPNHILDGKTESLCRIRTLESGSSRLS